MRNLITLIDAIMDTYDRADMKPLEDGTTFCNLAVSAVAYAMGCSQLQTKTADQIIEFIGSNSDWSEVPLEKVQDMANQGSLCVAGLDSSALNQSHGHVVVIRPGKPCYSGKWGVTPRCLNVGKEMFLARANRGPLIGMPCGLNEAFVPMPKIWIWRPSL